jgi:hypothetical protein
MLTLSVWFSHRAEERETMEMLENIQLLSAADDLALYEDMELLLTMNGETTHN